MLRDVRDVENEGDVTDMGVLGKIYKISNSDDRQQMEGWT